MRNEGVTSMELTLFRAIELTLVTSKLQVCMRTEGVTTQTNKQTPRQTKHIYIDTHI